MELTRAKIRVLRDLQTAGWCTPETLRCSDLTLSGLFDAGLIEGRSAPARRGRTTRWRITDTGRIALAGAPPEMHDLGTSHYSRHVPRQSRGADGARQDADGARLPRTASAVDNRRAAGASDPYGGC